LSPKVRANELTFLQKGSASVSLAVSRILRDTSSIVAALSKRHAPQANSKWQVQSANE
jgi:hypothetical protein